MRLKRTFKCPDCGVEFEMEADAFVPGVYGVMYDNDGKPFYFIDPTTEHLCPTCNDIFVEKLLAKAKKEESHGYDEDAFFGDIRDA